MLTDSIRYSQLQRPYIVHYYYYLVKAAALIIDVHARKQ